MSLVDFMQQLQDQDNIIYSEAPEPSIRVIPPETTCTKIIPPENTTVKPPTTIKLKINQKNVDIKHENVEVKPNPVIQEETSNNNDKPPLSKSEPVQQSALPTESSVQPTTNQQKQQTKQTNQQPVSDEDVFISTGTELSKKDIWMEYYEKAKRSRKSNPISDRMKAGRFTITPDNKVLILPDHYNIVGKDPDDILKDKWF